MKYSARMHNVNSELDVLLKKGDQTNMLKIPVSPSGFGSSVSGGELLFLAIAACYCNDIYREAKNSGIQVDSVEVDVDGDFMAAGRPATNVGYKIKVTAQASEEEIRKLIAHTDAMAEIPLSLRNGTTVSLLESVAVSSQ